MEPWFEDPETQRFLGGPGWPAQMLALADRAVGTEFRGAVQTGAFRYLASVDGRPVGYIDCGTFDRCVVDAGEGGERPTRAERIGGARGATAFVVDPALRGRGLCRAMLFALMRRPELAGVELFEAGVEPDNVASRRCLEAAGFRLRSERPDFEGFLYYDAGRGEL